MPPERRIYGGLPDKAPGTFDGQLLAFADDLRSEGIAIGTSEMLDAFAALTHIAWTSQDDFRETLAATLAKSPEDRRVFEQKLVMRRDGGIRIGPVAEHSDGNLIVAYGVGGNRRDSAQPRRRQQRRYSKQSFHTPLFEKSSRWKRLIERSTHRRHVCQFDYACVITRSVFPPRL